MLLDTRPVVMLDLNGTVHAYSKGWVKDAPLYDPPTEGFREWAEDVGKAMRIVVWPTHMNSPRDMAMIRRWFKKHDLHKLGLELTPHPPRGLKLKIDDRAVCFTGNWRDFPVDMLMNFSTWSGR